MRVIEGRDRCAHFDPEVRCGEIVDEFGENVHLLWDLSLMTLLAKLSDRSTSSREVRHLVRRIYDQLVARVAANELIQGSIGGATPMYGKHGDRGFLQARGFDLDQRVVVVSLERAGSIPVAQAVSYLEQFIPRTVHRDVLAAERETDANGAATGKTLFGGHKLTWLGDYGPRTSLWLPDPMGATGGSISGAISRYKRRCADKGFELPGKIVAIFGIVAPECIRRLLEDHPEMVIYAARFDRGLSPKEVLDMRPGLDPRERGLDDDKYIVPGAGGLGERLDNEDGAPEGTTE